ncbi:MAG TPA: DUF167 domain-containing protein [Mycobacteriales bacterium]|jgi:uncharacterized protein YggU (UPF0235/DUF167 family)|nr:DUF167 domain-containing protein [Mycobacteriales bacterium]
MRVVVRVYPGSARSQVGGRYGQAEPPTLMVRVRERAVEGKANDAVLAEVARAFGLSRTGVRLVTGARSRTKLLELDGAEPEQLAALLARDKP